MKKVMALFLSSLLLMSLAACGDGNTTTSNTEEESSSTVEEESNSDEDETVVENTDNNDDKALIEDVIDDETEAQDTEAEGIETEEDESIESDTEETETSFEELVVVDNDECAITITGIDADNIWGYTLTALLENKSSDKTYMFSVDDASINGVKCDPYFASEVTAGKKSNEEISFYNSDTLEENGITVFTDIELTFSVYDNDDWTADDVANVTVHVYPYGEENATTFERENLDTDIVLVDNEYVTVIVTGCEYDDVWGYAVNLYLVNKTDSKVMYSVDNASVNGYMVDPYYADTVAAGTCAFSSMYWYSEDLEDNGITEVDEIEFELNIYDNDDWAVDNYVSETITLNP
ncbi:MAG: hypothetical protein LUC30_09515 [Clostridiales bacterium]|nr:hypothetical protein [Clostridiales bacterium]